MPGVGEPLTPREAEVLGRVADDRTNDEIAEALVVSAETVKTHISHIMDKTDCHDRRELARRQRAGEFDAGP